MLDQDVLVDDAQGFNCLLVSFFGNDDHTAEGRRFLCSNTANAHGILSDNYVFVDYEAGKRAIQALKAHFGRDKVFVTTEAQRAIRGKKKKEKARRPAAAPPEKARVRSAWEVLWVRKGAPPEVVKAAYKALAAKYHPDHGGSEARMRQINEAYAELSD